VQGQVQALVRRGKLHEAKYWPVNLLSVTLRILNPGCRMDLGFGAVGESRYST